MAVKSLKNRKQFTSTIRNDLYEKIREYSEKTDVPLSKIIDNAIEKYLKKSDKT